MMRRTLHAGVAATLIALVIGPGRISQGQSLAPNGYPNPYRLIETWAPVTANAATPPTWPEHQVVGISFDTSGNLVLLQRADPPVMVLDPTGQKVIRSFGEGVFTEPHGSAFLPDGTTW